MAVKYFLFIKHRSGAMHKLSGAKGTKFYKEILAGRGGMEAATLTENGYEGFLATDGEVHDWEDLKADQFGTYH